MLSKLLKACFMSGCKNTNWPFFTLCRLRAAVYDIKKNHGWLVYNVDYKYRSILLIWRKPWIGSRQTRGWKKKKEKQEFLFEWVSQNMDQVGDLLWRLFCWQKLLSLSTMPHWLVGSPRAIISLRNSSFPIDTKAKRKRGVLVVYTRFEY